MYAEQTLKGDGKTSMLELISKHRAVRGRSIRNFLPYKSSLIRFLTKRLQFNLKRSLKSNVIKKENKLDDLAKKNKKVKIVRIEISSEKMNTLLADRLICAADVRCLDRKSKQCIQALCLNTCLQKPKHSNPGFQLRDELHRTDYQQSI